MFMDSARCFTNCSLAIRLLPEEQPTKQSGCCLETNRDRPRLLESENRSRTFNDLPEMPRERSESAVTRSALALAEDLEHWLKHEPIRAKRSGFFTHATQMGAPESKHCCVSHVVWLPLAAGLGVTVWNHESAVVRFQRASQSFHLKI